MTSASSGQLSDGRGVPEHTDHLPVLTGLRGVAALWVYLYHVWGMAGHPQFNATIGDMVLDFTPLVSLGGAGVTLFFVLSGFLLSLPFAEWQAGRRDRPRPGRYFLRRLLRVFPAYYAQLALLLIVAVAMHGMVAVPEISILLRHLAMLFVPPPLGVAPINGVWWTLPIEFSFYLALPWLAFLLKPRRWLMLLLTSFVVMWIWRHAVILSLADSPIPLRVISAYQLPGAFDMFGLGMLAAVIHVNRTCLPGWLKGFFRHDAAAVAGLTCLVVSVYWLAGNRAFYWADYPIFYLWTPLLSLGTALLILSGTGGSRLALALFANRPIIYAGLVSYSVYLWHFPLLEWLKIALPENILGNFASLLSVSLPMLLLVATISYRVVEQPFIRLCRPSGMPGEQA